MQKTRNATVRLYFTRKHDISWIMLKVRECLSAGRRFHVVLCKHKGSVSWWRDNLFLFQLFFNLFLSSAEPDVFNFFFSLLHSFAIRPFLFRSYHFVRLFLCFCIHFKQFLWRVSYIHDAIFLCVCVLFWTPWAERNEKNKMMMRERENAKKNVWR